MYRAMTLCALLVCAGLSAGALLGCEVPLDGDEGAPLSGNGTDGGAPANASPTVVVGPDRFAREGFPVSLVAVPDDPDGDPLTIDWEQLAGVLVVLVATDDTMMEFDAPVVNSLEEASLIFRVTVRDDRGGQATDTVTVRVIMAGDVDMDDVVSERDEARVGELFEAGGEPGPDGEGDLNGDGRVDGRDLSIVLEDFGRSL